MIAPLCSSKTAFLPVDQVKRPEKAVFVFEKVFMCKKLHLFGFLNFVHQTRDLTPKSSGQWILPGTIVGQASRSDSPQSDFDPFFKFHSKICDPLVEAKLPISVTNL